MDDIALSYLDICISLSARLKWKVTTTQSRGIFSENQINKAAGVSKRLQRLVSTLLTIFISIYTSSEQIKILFFFFGAFITGSRTKPFFLPSTANMFAQSTIT